MSAGGTAHQGIKNQEILESIDDNFLTQVIEELMRNGALLGCYTHKQGWAPWGREAEGSFSCSNNESQELRILR